LRFSLLAGRERNISSSPCAPSRFSTINAIHIGAQRGIDKIRKEYGVKSPVQVLEKTFQSQIVRMSDARYFKRPAYRGDLIGSANPAKTGHGFFWRNVRPKETHC
jgi:hypothetical protein